MRVSAIRRVLIALLLTAGPVAAGTTPVRPPLPQHLRALDRMMQSLSHESARGALAIKESYDDHLELLYLEEYEAMEGALATGGLVPLPLDARYNLMPRLEGPHPIGEKDLDNQDSYVAARPFTVGCLLEIASRVKSGPIEITSLVRHGEYQDALLRTNSNARTDVPTHTMGLAFDIALINSPMKTVLEIRDVLREMRDAGDLLFIGERRQLVFHVVPHPSRLGHFMDVYTKAIGAPSAVQAAQVVAPAPLTAKEIVVTPVEAPRVTTEVVSVLPADAAHDRAWREATAALAPRPSPAPAPAAPVRHVPPVHLILGLVLMSAAAPAGLIALWKALCSTRAHENGAHATHPGGGGRAGDPGSSHTDPDRR